MARPGHPSPRLGEISGLELAIRGKNYWWPVGPCFASLGVPEGVPTHAATIGREANLMTTLDSVVRMLKSERDQLAKQMEGISAALAAFGAFYRNKPGRRSSISARGRARIAAAQRARWAKVRGNSKGNVVAMPKKRTMSAAARNRIAAAQRARWAKVRAGKKG
jgi:hypothetical protein